MGIFQPTYRRFLSFIKERDVKLASSEGSWEVEHHDKGFVKKIEFEVANTFAFYIMYALLLQPTS